MIIRDDVKKIVDKYGFNDWEFDYEDVVDGMFDDIKSAIEMSVHDKVNKRQKGMIDELEKESFQQISDKGLEFRSNGDPGVVNMVSVQDVIDSSKDDSVIDNAVDRMQEMKTEPDFDDFMLGVQTAEDCMKRGIYKSRPYFFWMDRLKFEIATQSSDLLFIPDDDSGWDSKMLKKHADKEFRDIIKFDE